MGSPTDIEIPEWFCSCGGASIGGSVEENEAERRRHAEDNPGHWPLTQDEWLELECAHCPCFDGEPYEDDVCCKCGEPYQAMTEIGGRRVFIKDALGGA